MKSSDRVAIGEQLSGWLINACVKLVVGMVYSARIRTSILPVESNESVCRSGGIKSAEKEQTLMAVLCF